jgi:DNA-binding NarL/FixJ family response regulator
MTIRVLVADDHHVVRAGLEQLLGAAAGIEFAGAACDGAEAVALAATAKPDVVLMDLSMPGVDGIEATRRIVADAPATRVVVLTSFSDRERILEVLDAGAVGYLLKDAEPEDLIAGIRAAAGGDSPLAPRIAAEVLDARLRDRETREPAVSDLTQREREVLGLVGEGKPNKLIARELGISERTVKAHLTSIFQRIGVSDRTQAALWVRERSA